MKSRLFSSEEIEMYMKSTFSLMKNIFFYIFSAYSPAPSKGCQMVPKGYQISIPQGLIGTPLKVQGGIHLFIFFPGGKTFLSAWPSKV